VKQTEVEKQEKIEWHLENRLNLYKGIDNY